MIVNTDKLLVILLSKRKSDLTNFQLDIDDQAVKSVSPVKLLGYYITGFNYCVTGFD